MLVSCKKHPIFSQAIYMVKPVRRLRYRCLVRGLVCWREVMGEEPPKPQMGLMAPRP